MNNNQEHATEKYTCPMHPEVRSTASGKCLKCDINLVLEGQTKLRIHIAQEDNGLGPITTVTLIENIGMATLAGILLTLG